jgi:hypothetical protein
VRALITLINVAGAGRWVRFLPGWPRGVVRRSDQDDQVRAWADSPRPLTFWRVCVLP